MRAADKWDSARFLSFWRALGLYCAQAESTLRPIPGNANTIELHKKNVQKEMPNRELQTEIIRSLSEKLRAYYVFPDVAEKINAAKAAGGRVIGVGTTSVRTLESAGVDNGRQTTDEGRSPMGHCPSSVVKPFAGPTSIFILPGYQYKVVDAMITNFHLPKSTLIMMISAFAGRENVLNAYETAKREGYRFFSFGDAMLIM